MNHVTPVTRAADPRPAGGAIAGFVTVVGPEIEQRYVEAGWRGTGVAGPLLAHGEGIVAERFPVAWLAVVPGNSRARRFHERRGWHDTGPFDNPAETRQGTLLVACRRYEKHVARAVSA